MGGSCAERCFECSKHDSYGCCPVDMLEEEKYRT